MTFLVYRFLMYFAMTLLSTGGKEKSDRYFKYFLFYKILRPFLYYFLSAAINGSVSFSVSY